MQIVGMNKTTLLDYPGRVAATVFTGGCNFRCPFCHNGNLVLKPSALEAYSEEEVFCFLKKRKPMLKGLCITGGEPTLQPDLPVFISKVKALGYAVKLDTNGYRPEVLQMLLQEGLLDYVAMDIKTCKEKYGALTGLSLFSLEKIEASAALLKASGVDYEFRTTVVKELHTEQDLQKIGEWIAGCSRYFLQQYQENENELHKLMAEEKEDALGSTMQADGIFHGYDKAEMEHFAEKLNQLPGLEGKVALRGLG